MSGYANIYSAKAPPRLIKHSLASPSTVADVMTQKYVDGAAAVPAGENLDAGGRGTEPGHHGQLVSA